MQHSRRRSIAVLALLNAVLSTLLLAGAAPSVATPQAPNVTATTDLVAASKVSHGLLRHVIGEVPTYQPGTVHWRLSLRLGRWGQTDWETHTITISVLVPLPYLYSVVVHEWSHELQALDYDGQLWPMVKALNRRFGGAGKTGVHGTEIAADCMAILQGATWTRYTPCHRPAWRKAARRLVNGHRV